MAQESISGRFARRATRCLNFVAFPFISVAFVLFVLPLRRAVAGQWGSSDSFLEAPGKGVRPGCWLAAESGALSVLEVERSLAGAGAGGTQ